MTSYAKARERLITVSGPRGSGKGTIVDALVAEIPGLRRVVPHTTRRPRGYEINGREYYFVSESEFEKLRGAGRFVWWSQIGPTQLAGTVYGELLCSAPGLVLDVLPTGAIALRDYVLSKGGSTLLMAVLAPRDQRALRIQRRQPELSLAEIQRLLDEDPAWQDDQMYQQFDVIVSNTGPDAADSCAHAVATARRFLTT